MKGEHVRMLANSAVDGLLDCYTGNDCRCLISALAMKNPTLRIPVNAWLLFPPSVCSSTSFQSAVLQPCKYSPRFSPWLCTLAIAFQKL